jgi:hypothetical protein
MGVAQNITSRCKKLGVRSSYGNKRVFLDIPYRKGYHPCERSIVATLLCYGLNPVLAKENRQTKFILNDVCDLIRSAKYAVVDISGLNFNVAFEVGFLHALGELEFILLKDRKTKIPANLLGLKYSQYSNKDSLIRELNGWIRQNIPEAKLSPYTKDLEDILRKVKQKTGVSQEHAREMLLTLMVIMMNSDGSLPLR